MRTSILSRSVIAVASLAIGSVALAATPATAASPSGITRDQVLTAANNYRAGGTMEQYFTVILPQFTAIARSACGPAAGEEPYFDISPTAAGQAADGFLLKVYNDEAETSQCLVAILATTDPAKTLAGSLTVNATTAIDYPDGPKTVRPPASQALSGDVFVSAPITVSGDTYIDDASFTANGNTTRSFKVTTTTKVKDKKTTSEKKSAKKKFEKRNKAAKKSYKKALDKAGKSKYKKAAAKRAYSAKKASVKAKYKYSTANYKLVKKTTIAVDNTPFAFNIALYPPAP